MPKFKELVRMFVAVEIAQKSALQIEKLMTVFASCGADIKWVESGQFHVTLKFLGDVEREDMASVCTEFQKAVKDVPPFEIQAIGAGAFPKIELPRTVWVGVEDPSNQLTAAFNAVEAAAVKMGFVRENKPFKPHITLGRIRKPTSALRDLSEKIAQYPRCDLGKTFVKHIDVLSSELTRRGPLYAVLARCPLQGVTLKDED
ncbi:MAG: RNA 2',3'-cyclic phosphodiesterase [Thermoguttaceae bacterium]|nr:RNA 2',3'-cyclic phosphodiesterase [Thermoguttaceae bacterium]